MSLQARTSKSETVPAVNTKIQRACSCGAQAGVSGQCANCAAKEKLGAHSNLRISAPDDRYEREADRIADQVVSKRLPNSHPR